MFIKCYTSLRWSGSFTLEHGSAVHLIMAYENQVPVHASGKPWLLWLSPWVLQRSPSAAGASLYYTEHIITNTKSGPLQKQLPGPNKEQGSLIPVPTCFWVPGAHAGLGQGLWEKRGHLCPPHRQERGTLHCTPFLKAGPSREGEDGAPEGGVPGRGGQHGAPRAGTSEGLVHPADAAVQLQHPQRRHARPAAPPAASEHRPPVPPRFRSPARPGLRGLAGRSGNHGRDRPRGTRPPPALPPPRCPWGGGSATCALLAVRGRRGTRYPPWPPWGSGRAGAAGAGSDGWAGATGARPHEGRRVRLRPGAWRCHGPGGPELTYGDVFEKSFRSPHRKEGNY